MAFLGLSGDTLTFLGGVAEGASKEIDRQLERQQEAIKEASSTAIRARLAARKKYDDNIAEVTKQIRPLLAQYNINDVASLMQLPEAERNKVVSALASVAGKDDKGAFFKTIKQFGDKTPLTQSELINALVPAYKESKIDYSGLIPNTAVDVLFGFDPKDELERRVEAGAGPLRKSPKTINLSEYGKGLNLAGKIKTFAEDAGDVTGYTKNVTTSVFRYMGGNTDKLQNGVFRDVELVDGDKSLAERFSALLMPQYARRVREMQIDLKLSREEAEAQAKVELQQFLTNRFDPTNFVANRKLIQKMTGTLIKTGLTLQSDGYSGLLKGDSSTKSATNLRLLGVEQRIQSMDKSGILITNDVRNEMKNEIRRVLSSQGYSETEILKVLDRFLKRMNKYMSVD